MKRAAWFLASCLLVTPLLAQPQIPALNWVARSDWVNVKTDVTPAAVGDGVADDTAAIQKALEGVKDGSIERHQSDQYAVRWDNT